MTDTNKRIIYLDALRALSAFLVVLLHVSANGYESLDVQSNTWLVYDIYNSVTRGAVPVFVMISGALFLQSKKQIPLRQLYSKYILKMVILYVFWSAVYALASLVIQKDTAFFRNFIHGEYHMWFLPMMAGLYMLLPFLKRIAEDEKLLKYFVILGFIFNILLPYASLFSESIVYLSDKLKMRFVISFVFYFLLGAYLHKAIIKIKSIYAALLFAAVLVFKIVFNKAALMYALPFSTDNSFSAENFLLSVFGFLFVKNLNWEKIGERTKRLISTLSQYALGIYVFHVLAKALLKYIGLTTQAFHPIISIPVITVLTYLISLFVCYVMKKIPIVKKYLV